jgi:hypothetical protein
MAEVASGDVTAPKPAAVARRHGAKPPKPATVVAPGVPDGDRRVAGARVPRPPDVLDTLLARSVAQRTSGSAQSRRLQRTVVSKVVKDDVLDDIIAKIDAIVQRAYTTVLNEPLHATLKEIDGYTRRWITVFLNYRQTKETEFLYRAFGYAVESIAGQELRSLRLPAIYSISLQATRGGTRPDIVVKHMGADIGWFDITSSASQGHIYKKNGAQWKRLDYVAEVVYPALDVDLLGAKSLDSRQREEALHATAEMKTIRDKMAERLAAMKALIPPPLASNNQAVKKRDVETRLGMLFGYPKLTPRITKGILSLANLSIAHYGYKGASARGRDTDAAEDLIYAETMQLAPGDEERFNRHAISLHGEMNVPTEGFDFGELFSLDELSLGGLGAFKSQPTPAVGAPLYNVIPAPDLRPQADEAPTSSDVSPWWSSPRPGTVDPRAVFGHAMSTADRMDEDEVDEEYDEEYEETDSYGMDEN